jgi:hypothetical protein
VTLLPLYTTEEGGTLSINSDTWLGDTRAVMIKGPSREGLELVEVR